MARLGFEPRSSGYEPDVEPLHYRAEPHLGFEPRSPVWKTGMLPLHQWGKSRTAGCQFPSWSNLAQPGIEPGISVLVQMGGIEPPLPVPKTGVMPFHYIQLSVTAVLAYGWSRPQCYLAPPVCASPLRAPPVAPLKLPFSRPISLSRCFDAAVPPTKASSSA